VGDETARAGARWDRTARRALGERRVRLQLHNRMENGVRRSALSSVVEAAARQQQKDQDRTGPSHLVH